MTEETIAAIDKNDLVEKWKSNMETLDALFKNFSDKNFNTIPFEGSWTGAQLCNHLLKSWRGLVANMNGPTAPADRDPAMHVEQLKTIILDFNQKYNAPEHVVPEHDPLDRSIELASLRKLSSDVLDSISGLDLSRICLSVPFFRLGNLSRMEWLSFNIYHTQRHIRQLNKIVEHLSD